MSLTSEKWNVSLVNHEINIYRRVTKSWALCISYSIYLTSMRSVFLTSVYRGGKEVQRAHVINGRSKFTLRSAFFQNSCWGWDGVWRRHEAVFYLSGRFQRQFKVLKLSGNEPTEWYVFSTIGEWQNSYILYHLKYHYHFSKYSLSFLCLLKS